MRAAHALALALLAPLPVLAQHCGGTVRAATPAVATKDPPKWQAQHEAIRARLAAAPPAEIVFVGDSITAHFSDDDRFAHLPGLAGHATLNLAVPGDQTENVLWRLDHLPLEQVHPRQVVLLIGTNNLRGDDTACDILAGIDAIIGRLRAAWPDAQVVVIGILPRGKDMQFALERRRAINEAMAARRDIRFVDPTDALVCGGSNGCGYYQDDLLHLMPAGYDRLWSVLRPQLHR
jgi:platelet-activating factor acetylhydrolase IB subunit beta/gamma